jgi:trk system potassium uptake protein TrkA
VLGVVGNGATHSTLIEAGVDTADLLISVTDSDELNLLCCIIAKKTGKCRVIARVTSPEYSTEAEYLKDELGLEMIINPESASAQEIARILRFPSAIGIETFAKGKVELLTFKLPDNSKLCGTSVKDIVLKLKCNVLVCTVERDNEAHIPHGDFTFMPRDIISLIASHENAYDFFRKAGHTLEPVKNALILGAGKMTHYLCSALNGYPISLKVIDSDKALCNELCIAFDKVSVINGNETDRDLLVEEGVKNAGAFISLTAQDEQNILLSLFGVQEKCGKVITRVSNAEYDDIVSHLDLDTIIYPKNVTVNIITRYVRSTKNALGSDIENMYYLSKGNVEALEFTVKGDSAITALPLMQLSLKRGILVAAILRDGEVIIPRGHDKITAGDTVIIVSKHKGLRDISDILE